VRANIHHIVNETLTNFAESFLYIFQNFQRCRIIEMASSPDLKNLATPPACIADFCIIPLGTPTASVSKEVAQVQRLLKQSGLAYSMHSAGTTVGM